MEQFSREETRLINRLASQNRQNHVERVNSRESEEESRKDTYFVGYKNGQAIVKVNGIETEVHNLASGGIKKGEKVVPRMQGESQAITYKPRVNLEQDRKKRRRSEDEDVTALEPEDETVEMLFWPDHNHTWRFGSSCMEGSSQSPWNEQSVAWPTLASKQQGDGEGGYTASINGDDAPQIEKDTILDNVGSRVVEIKPSFVDATTESKKIKIAQYDRVSKEGAKVTWDSDSSRFKYERAYNKLGSDSFSYNLNNKKITIKIRLLPRGIGVDACNPPVSEDNIYDFMFARKSECLPTGVDSPSKSPGFTLLPDSVLRKGAKAKEQTDPILKEGSEAKQYYYNKDNKNFYYDGQLKCDSQVGNPGIPSPLSTNFVTEAPGVYLARVKPMSALEYNRNGFLDNVGIVTYRGGDALRYNRPTTLTAEENKEGFTDFVYYKLGYKEGEEEFLGPWGSWQLSFEPEKKDPGDGEEEKEEEEDPPKPSPTPAPSPYPTPAPAPSPSPSPAPAPAPSPSPSPAPAPAPSPSPTPAPAPSPSPSPAPAPAPSPTPEPANNPCKELKGNVIASQADTPDVFFWDKTFTGADGSTYKQYYFRFGGYDVNGDLAINFTNPDELFPRWSWGTFPAVRAFNQGVNGCPLASRKSGNITEIYITGGPP